MFQGGDQAKSAHPKADTFGKRMSQKSSDAQMLKRGPGVRAFPAAHVKITDKTRCLTFCRHSAG
jgi:hypothetical protein